MMKIFKKIYHNTKLGKILIFMNQIIIYYFVSDKRFAERRFKKRMGYKLNLNDPKTLNEKINWLKLNNRTELHTLCADKYKVRQYIQDNIGEKFLVPLCFETKNPKDIIPSNLPDYPCIIKTNHDSGGGIFIFDKNEIDYNKIRSQLAKRLKKNYYAQSREWQYKNIEPRIIVEKLLLDNEGNIPFDYKVHCFNGKPRMIQVDMGRGTENHYRNWYDENWSREPYKWSMINAEAGKVTDPSPDDIERPKHFEEMLSLSSKLAYPFDYVRVDWYDLNGALFFGELTFHHDGGSRPITPKEWDFKLGEELKLKISKY